MDYRELATPALIIDLDVAERNLDRMADYCRGHNLKLRPHTKTHKTVEFAGMQLERGAIGLTVAKVGEAEVMAQSGAKQILVAHPIFGQEQLQRLARVAAETEVLIAIDHEATAQAISRAAVRHGCEFGILVEFDAGFHRCGLAPGSSCTELADAVEKLPGLRLRGLMTYFGNIWGSKEERRAQIASTASAVEQAIAAFQKERLPIEIVSGGSTPAADFSHQIPGLTEIRPGTYIFNDLNTYYQGVCRLEDCAARVLTTVISTAVPGHAMVDAGSKTISSDTLGSGPMKGYGYVEGNPATSLLKLNEEHGYLDTSQGRRFQMGEVLTVIPNHVCTCINMHDEVFLVRGEQVIGSWKVAARGKIR
jgi:D-serine deaminase-like pyridoxal phosphate-dependent protein